MNESQHKQLRRQIERVVRPVQASPARKNRMREELLGHLARLYEEECDRARGDQGAALAAAAERFGDPAGLRRELQATVPIVERVAWRTLPGIPHLERRPGESATTFVARSARWVLAIAILSWVSVFAIVVLSGRPGGRPISLGNLLLFGVFGTILYLLGLLGHPLLCEAIRREWSELPPRGTPGRGRAIRRLFVRTVIAAALLAALIPAFLTMINVAAGFPIFTGRLFAGLAAILALPLTTLQVRSMQHFEDWGSLEIDGELAS